MKRILLSLMLSSMLASCAPGAIVSTASVVSLESLHLSEKGQQEIVERVKKELAFDELMLNKAD